MLSARIISQLLLRGAQSVRPAQPRSICVLIVADFAVARHQTELVICQPAVAEAPDCGYFHNYSIVSPRILQPGRPGGRAGGDRAESPLKSWISEGF